LLLDISLNMIPPADAITAESATGSQRGTITIAYVQLDVLLQKHTT
jgi:hypothetical protein